MSRDDLIVISGVCKDYKSGQRVIRVLRSVSLTARRGEFICIVGASGAGKTTLLHILGMLSRPTCGTVTYDGHDIFRSNDRELSRFRNERIGFVFQFHHLLPELNAVENVAMPLLIRRESWSKAADAAMRLLEMVGLGQRWAHRPSELSFGEQQRVAVARALVGEPEVVLADEPIGNLDWETGERVFSTLVDLTVGSGKTLVVVSHNLKLAQRADSVLRLVKGRCEPYSA